MSKMIRLNESDLKHMVRRVVNEILSMEGGEDSAQYPGDRYYYDGGFANGDQRPAKANSDNPFTAEGAVGENYDEFVSQIQEYVDKKMEEYESRKGRAQRAFDNFLKGAEERHGRLSRKTQKSHELKNRERNMGRGTNHPEFLRPGGTDQTYHDMLKAKIESEAEDNKNWLQNELRIEIEMPNGESRPSGWKEYVQVAPPTKAVWIDPDNVEEACRKAWQLFNDYASRTDGVVGWWLWQWSTFKPTMKPILSPEIGKIMQDEDDAIGRFYASYGPGDYVGD